MPTDRTVGDTVTESNNVTGVVAGYGSIASALAASSAGDTITCVRNGVDLSGGANIEISVSVTLRVHDDCRVSAPSKAQLTAKAYTDYRIRVLNGAQGLVIDGLGFNGPASGCTLLQASCTIKNCVMYDDYAFGCLFTQETYIGSTQYVIVLNCALIAADYVPCVYQAAPDVVMNVYHTSACKGSGSSCFSRDAGTLNTYACIAKNGDSNWGGTVGGDENVSSDATAPGTTYWHSQTGVFANTSSGSEDLSLSAGAQGDYGVSDYSGTYGDLATDIAGTTRTGTIDAGVWQTPAAAATSFVPRTRPAHFVHLRR